MRIVVRLGAAWMIRSKTCCMRELRPMMSPKRCAAPQVLPQGAVLGDQAPLLGALRRTTSTSSFLNGLVM